VLAAVDDVAHRTRQVELVLALQFSKRKHNHTQTNQSHGPESKQITTKNLPIQKMARQQPKSADAKMAPT
jgi:hypothetical protein